MQKNSPLLNYNLLFLKDNILFLLLIKVQQIIINFQLILITKQLEDDIFKILIIFLFKTCKLKALILIQIFN